MNAVSVDDTNDIIPYAGDFKLCSGKSAYGTIIKAAVLTTKGELQYNTGKGIPYFDTIFEDVAYADLWKSYVIDAITSFDFVHKVSNFTYKIDYIEHSITYSCDVLTDLGTISISG